MKILGIVPARGGSKGVPRKNIKLLNGRPLLYYTIDSIKESELLSKVILSTEDKEIAEIGMAGGLEVPFIRPLELAKDSTPTILVLRHAIQYYSKLGQDFDAVCILQVTSPFRPKGLIDDAIRQFIAKNVDTLISVREVPDDYNPHWVFFQNDDQSLKVSTGLDFIIPRRQNLPQSFHRDGAIYIVKKEQILNSDSLFGEKISGIILKNEDWVNIDTLNDWKAAEEILTEKR